jgi:hypothetical protein
VVDKPKGINLISTKWVFKVKMLPNGQIDKYKARLCVRGFTQEYGVDYFETFAPVIRMESLRILLALAAAQDWEIHQMDVVSAYLLGELEEEVYIEVPKGLDLQYSCLILVYQALSQVKVSMRCIPTIADAINRSPAMLCRASLCRPAIDSSRSVSNCPVHHVVKSCGRPCFSM